MSTKFRQKIRLAMICVGIWGTLLMMPVGQVEAQGAETVHIVRPGESLAQIAGRYGISYMDLARYNGISNPNILRVGQTVRVPNSTVAVVPVLVQSPTPTQTPVAAPTVDAPTVDAPTVDAPTVDAPTVDAPTVDTTPVQQASIAAPTPIQAEVAPTRQVSSPEAQPPVATPTKAAPVTVQPRVSNQACGTEISYSVRRGDSLYGISATYGVSVRTIIARNNLPSTLIYVGQRLIIPLPGC
jgi:LysM repeat protein